MKNKIKTSRWLDQRLMTSLHINESYISHKSDKDLQTIAAQYWLQISTERLVLLDTKWLVAQAVTKVILISRK